MEDISKIKLWWWPNHNAGDQIGPWIFDKLGVPYEWDQNNRECITCGSIMHKALPNTIIWGSGLHNAGDSRLVISKNITAVRGNLSKEELKLSSVAVGDPGLLLSYFYTPKTKRHKYKFGIVAHYIDYEDFKKVETSEIPVINMGTDNIEEVADKINECDFIFSSSLHGVVFAHSLGIPAIHIINKPLYSKNSFKFKDYFTSLGINYVEKKWDKNFKFLGACLDHPEWYVPTTETITKIQNDLLRSFPYKELVSDIRYKAAITEL